MRERLQPAASTDLRRLDPIVGEQIKSIADPYRSQRGQLGLFTGASGSDKTLAARILGQLLGYPAYRVDLSAAVSKYIGETEKNLAQAFDEAETSGVILFFDEADTLFGKRSQVADANDRYANTEVSFLLQRLEDFDGIAILATNSRGNIDAAFLHRFSWTVDFPNPGPARPLSLWEKSLRWIKGAR